MVRGGCIYFMTNKNKTTLYLGVTSNLIKRVSEHKNHTYKDSFTDRYNLEMIVFYEFLTTIEEAILREKQVKKWNRTKKNELINALNPDWTDLWTEISTW